MHCSRVLRMTIAAVSVRFRTIVALLVLLGSPAADADQVAVRHAEGMVHGFLAVRTVEGKRLADGEISQIAEGDLVRSHLVFHFADGSLYEEEATFTQKGTFRLRTDHLVQKGPSFKRPIETSIDAASGRVKARYTDDDGREQTVDEQMKLPDDVANGLLFTLLRHIDPSTPQTAVPQLAMTPKPRLVTLTIIPRGDEPFTSGNSRYKAMHYVVKVKIGGIAGLLAPLLGRQPVDMHVWIMRGEVPAFIKFEGPLYNDGPVWRVELADSAKFP
ncbi:MAG TPA: hypothetical protein VFF44_11975 [Casimicrobiaceae bacterium]|nr:hypothetical protein [Casimicrobiaceae bacterium]